MWIIHWLSLLSVLHCEIRISNKYCNFFNPINTENILSLISTIKIITLFFCFTTAKLNTVLNYAAFIASVLEIIIIKKPFTIALIRLPIFRVQPKNRAYESPAQFLIAKLLAFFFFLKTLKIGFNIISRPWCHCWSLLWKQKRIWKKKHKMTLPNKLWIYIVN